MSIFIFRRDLRIADNIGLLELQKYTKEIIPIFIFTPEQITNKNKYRSKNAIQFMIESLFDLENQLKQLNNTKKSPIMFFYVNVIDVLNSIKKRININSIYINLDYTPYSKERDLSIKSFCNKMNIKYNEYHDICLFPPKTILTDNISTYKKFTPFYNKCIENISSIQKINNQHDKIECILKIYKVIYENRDVILGLHKSNERFIQFIEVIYTKSKSVMASIINIIPDYNGDLETLLLTIYYLDKTKTFFHDMF